jgi:glycosyltransferase involved in cell wall biosynthesis
MLLTVFTPSYNRGSFLHACFDSLVSQNIDFEWIIIDDGSTDNTPEVVSDIQAKSAFPIRYHRQENAGKQSAWNVASNMARGKYFIGLDSDDQITPGGLSHFLKYVAELESDPKVIGVRACAVRTSDGKNDAANFFAEGQISSWFNEFSRPAAHGERIDILKTDIIRRFPYPVSANTKFIPEIWFYATTAAAGYQFIYTTDPVRLFLDDHSHLRLSRSSLYAHAQGHLISRTVLLNSVPFFMWIRNPIGLMKTLVRLAQVRGVEEIGPFRRAGLQKNALPYLALIAPIQIITKSLK